MNAVRCDMLEDNLQPISLSTCTALLDAAGAQWPAHLAASVAGKATAMQRCKAASLLHNRLGQRKQAHQVQHQRLLLAFPTSRL